MIQFCATRRAATKTAEYLDVNYIQIPTKDRVTPSAIQDKKLRELVANGYAHHHAGLAVKDRETVEQLFLSGKIRVLCATGSINVNLSARLVIVKSTQQYTGKTYAEYSEVDTLRMLGRAGRTQDNLAVAVLLTNTATEGRYKTLSEGRAAINSRLADSLPDFLLADVANGSIQSVQDVRNWTASTFLCCCQRNTSQFLKGSAVDGAGCVVMWRDR